MNSASLSQRPAKSEEATKKAAKAAAEAQQMLEATQSPSETGPGMPPFVQSPQSPQEQEADRVASRVRPDPSPSSHRSRVAEPDGAPLSPSLRRQIEPAVGADLSAVRVHGTGGDRALAQKLHAKAFTYQNHIWLGTNQSADDAPLMAHEAAHTVQQRRSGQATIQRQPETALSQAVDRTVLPPTVSPTDLEQSSFAEQGDLSADELQSLLTPPSDRDAMISLLETPDPPEPAADTSTQPENPERVDEAAATPATEAEGEVEGEGEAEGEASEAEGEASETEAAAGADLTVEEEEAMGLNLLSTGDLALIDEELAEHQRWGAALGRVGTAGSAERAGFIAEAAGSGLLGGASSGAAMGLTMGLASRAATKGAAMATARWGTRITAHAARFTPVPAVGAIIGGAMSAYSLATRDWGATADTIGLFGEGNSTYEVLANSLASISEIIDVVSNILNIVAGIMGVISAAMWVAAVLSAGALSPLALTLTNISLGIGIATGIMDLINSVVLQPCIVLFRTLHTFTTEADPREVEAQEAQISQAAGAVGGAIGSAAGARASRVGGGRPRPQAETDIPDIPPAATGDGPTVRYEAPPRPAADSGNVPTSSPSATTPPPTSAVASSTPGAATMAAPDVIPTATQPHPTPTPRTASSPTSTAASATSTAAPSPASPAASTPSAATSTTPTTPPASPATATATAPGGSATASGGGAGNPPSGSPDALTGMRIETAGTPTGELRHMTDADIDSFVAGIDSTARSDTYFELPAGQDVSPGQLPAHGLQRHNIRYGNPDRNKIQYHENMTFEGVRSVRIAEAAAVPMNPDRRPGHSIIPEGVGTATNVPVRVPPSSKAGQPFPLEVRLHSENPSPTLAVNEPLAHSRFNPTVQINTKGNQGNLYLLPDGRWVPQNSPDIGPAHYPVGGRDRGPTGLGDVPGLPAGTPSPGGGGSSSGGSSGSAPPTAAPPPSAAPAPVTPTTPPPTSTAGASPVSVNEVTPTGAQSPVMSSTSTVEPGRTGVGGPPLGSSSETGLPVIEGRTRGQTPLTPEQFAQYRAEAVRMGMPPDQIQHADATSTSYWPTMDQLIVGPDIHPLPPDQRPSGLANPANAALEPSAVLAHEIIGHREAEQAGQAHVLPWAEEAQASFRAALHAQGISPEQRQFLIQDAVARFRHQERPGTVYMYMDRPSALPPSPSPSSTPARSFTEPQTTPTVRGEISAPLAPFSPHPNGSSPPPATTSTAASSLLSTWALGNQAATLARQGEGESASETAAMSTASSGQGSLPPFLAGGNSAAVPAPSSSAAAPLSPQEQAQAAHRARFTADNQPVQGVERVNPNYPSPPGTPTQLGAIQEEIAILLAARAQAEETEARMDQQVEHHEANQAPIQAAQAETTASISAVQAHREAVARREQANQGQQQRQQEAQGLIGQYENRQAGMTALTVPLQAFRGLTHLASYLPGRAGRAMEEMNADANRILEAFDQMDAQMANQADTQPERQAELQTDQTRLETTDAAAEVSGQTYETALADAVSLQENNEASIAAAQDHADAATAARETADAEIATREQETQTLAAQMQSWAQAHQAARQEAIATTQRRVQDAGATIADVSEA